MSGAENVEDVKAYLDAANDETEASMAALAQVAQSRDFLLRDAELIEGNAQAIGAIALDALKSLQQARALLAEAGTAIETVVKETDKLPAKEVTGLKIVARGSRSWLADAVGSWLTPLINNMEQRESTAPGQEAAADELKRAVPDVSRGSWPLLRSAFERTKRAKDRL